MCLFLLSVFPVYLLYDFSADVPAIMFIISCSAYGIKGINLIFPVIYTCISHKIILK